MKKNKGRTALRWLAFILIPVIVILTVDYYVDSYASFRMTYNQIADTALVSNYYVSQDIQISERKEKWAIVNKSEAVEYMIWGSSRLLLVSKEMLGKEDFYNLSVSGGSSVKDYMAEAYILKSQNKLPKYLLIEISPYTFNANSGEYRYSEWGNCYDYMKRVLAGENVTADDSKLLGVQYKDIFSPGYFKYNFEMLLEGKRTGFSATDKSVDEEENIWHKDGSMTYSLSFQKLNTPESIQNRMASTLSEKTIYSCDSFYELDEERLSEFAALVNYLTNEGVEVSIYLPPYSEEMYEFICSEAYYASIPKVEEWIMDFAAGSGCQVYGSYNPKESQVTLSDFYDEYHIKEEKLPDTIYARFEDMSRLWEKD